MVAAILCLAAPGSATEPIRPGEDTPSLRELARGVSGTADDLPDQSQSFGSWDFEAIPAGNVLPVATCALYAKQEDLVFQVMRWKDGAPYIVVRFLDKLPKRFADGFGMSVQTDDNAPHHLAMIPFALSFSSVRVAAPGFLEELAAADRLTLRTPFGRRVLELTGTTEALAYYRACEARIGTRVLDGTESEGGSAMAYAGWSGGMLYDENGLPATCIAVSPEGKDAQVILQDGHERGGYVAAILPRNLPLIEYGEAFEGALHFDTGWTFDIRGFRLEPGYSFFMQEWSEMFRAFREGRQVTLEVAGLGDFTARVELTGIQPILDWLMRCNAYYHSP